MGSLIAAIALALSANVVSVDNSPLRAGCDANAKVVGQLSQGDPVEIRFALAGGSGTCYKVSVQSDGVQLEGYVDAEAIGNLEEFERARRAAAGTSHVESANAGLDLLRAVATVEARGEAAERATALLDENRPNDALTVVEAHLRSSDPDAAMLILAGYAAYQSDRIDLAVDYWKESLALNPNPTVEGYLSVAERELREDRSGERLFGAQVMLRYSRDVMEPALAHEALKMLEREYLRISQELGCRTDERIVAIAQSPEEYRRTTGAAEWSGGQYDGRIRVAVMDGSRLGENTRRTFSHELVHACLHQLGDYPLWLHEGLAQKLSGETLSSSELALVNGLAAEGHLPTLSGLGGSWMGLGAAGASVAYSTALAAVELIYEHHSGIGVRNLLRNPNLLDQVTQDIDRRLRQ